MADSHRNRLHPANEIARYVPERETALTIGVFDGVHLGHRHLIQELLTQTKERNLLSGVITFRTHPQEIFRPQKKFNYLTDLTERTRLLKKCGIDFIVALSFTPELAQLSAREFVFLLKKYLKVRKLVVGPDFALGRRREGNIAVLQALGREFGFTVKVVPPLMLNGEVVSSTAIRKALARGNVSKVRELLGRPYALKGKVVFGKEKGKSLGFPTANIVPNSNLALPPNGAYISKAYVRNRAFKAVTNIGVQPTFGEGKRMIETHLLNFEGDLYNRELKVEFVKRIRGEMKFNSIEELKAQIGRDVELAKGRF